MPRRTRSPAGDGRSSAVIGAATPFRGASIGFSDKSTNQDACKGAAIKLLYTANPD